MPSPSVLDRAHHPRRRRSRHKVPGRPELDEEDDPETERNDPTFRSGRSRPDSRGPFPYDLGAPEAEQSR